MGFFAIDQIAKIGLSSLQVIYYFEKLFIPSQLLNRIEYCIKVLHGYAYYLKEFRAKYPINLRDFKYGMS
ncbi:hypothetical protein PluTT01m_12720 [Photorhabdus laumondii subsp. laumondii]|nr:hypothetical protein PluTT01m_12720 [Photorhabdus laumondii subsp. laumondii]